MYSKVYKFLIYSILVYFATLAMGDYDEYKFDCTIQF